MKCTLTIAFFLLTSIIAKAQFTGCYSVANWTVNNTNTNGGLYSTTNYFDIIADTDMNGNNSPGVDCSTTNNGNVSVCITIPSTGTMNFSWTWSGGNNSTLLTEPFGYCINGIPTDLTNGINYTGSTSVPVTTGDNFCFVISSQFANSHPTLFSYIHINNFSGPCSPTGIGEILAGTNGISVAYESSSFIIRGTAAEGMLTLFNIQGKELAHQHCTERETVVGSGICSPGIYIIRYAENEKAEFIRAIIY